MKTSSYIHENLTGYRPQINTAPEGQKIEDDEYGRKYLMKSCSLICSNFKTKMLDHLLMGGEHTKKVSPGFLTPQAFIEELDKDEKLDIVLNDARFGMFSLFYYHLKHGYRNKELKKLNRVYCSHIFSLVFATPILIYLSQWILFFSLIFHEANVFEGDFCPNKGSIENKMVMAAIGIVYFVRGFFIWDNLTSRIGLHKTNRVDNLPAILDTIQEFLFNLIVYGANIWIIFSETDIQNMILNSLALEWLMRLDNEFEEMYFQYLPGAAEDIYDNIYVTYSENRTLLKNRYYDSPCFKYISYVLLIPYKILILCTFLFPFFCIFMTIAGPICK